MGFEVERWTLPEVFLLFVRKADLSSLYTQHLGPWEQHLRIHAELAEFRMGSNFLGP